MRANGSLQRLRRERLIDVLQHEKYALLHGSTGNRGLQRLHHSPLHPAQVHGITYMLLSISLATATLTMASNDPLFA